MKKFLSALLSLIMILSLVPMTAFAEAEYIEVNTTEGLKKALESNGDKNVIVSRDIIYTCSVGDVGAYWVTLGSGKKH